MTSTPDLWLPDRQDILWIDGESQAGRKMRDIQIFLVLSPQIFNDKTSLVIGLPMSTAESCADNPFTVEVDKALVCAVDKISYVLCHQPKSFDWRLRGAKPHPLGRLSDVLFVQVCERLNQIIQLTAQQGKAIGSP